MKECKHKLLKIIDNEKVIYFFLIWARQHRVYYVCEKCGRVFR